MNHADFEQTFEAMGAKKLDGHDWWTSIAADVYDCAPEDVTREMRSNVKMAGWMWMYSGNGAPRETIVAACRRMLR